MPTSGATIGPYKVDREIGRGGMGVVFLAHDTRLGRAVALKALPEDVSLDPDRLQRFEREARVLASLSHPNVAAIYGVEESDGHRYLALEHVEGETLADKLMHGPLSVQETVDICIQIAAGVEAAHDGGVIHRDLKPGNVMVSSNDRVKVLDFGLAKGRVATDESGLAKSPAMADSPTPSSPTLSSPTIPHSPTLPGVILGTAPYLSPEQARGKVVDRRTDIWSFGCILYECLTGRRAFRGETTSDTIAKILERDLDFSELPKITPARLRELLVRCLAKDPKKRLRDIGDARLALEEIKSGRYAGIAAEAATTSASRQRAAILLAVGGIAGIIVGILAWNSLGPHGRATHGQPTLLSVAIPQDVRVTSEFAALGGRALALLGETRATKDAEPISRLYVRRLDRDTFEPLRGTERALGSFVSPDGRWILFVAQPSEHATQVRAFKVPVDASSPPVPLTDWGQNWDLTGTWLESGEILVSIDDGSKYLRVPRDGGAPTQPRKFNAPGFTGRFYPRSRVLPGDRGVLLFATSYEGGVFHMDIGVLDLKSGKTKILIRDGGFPRYLPTGHLLFSRQDALFAVSFDLRSLQVRGEPVAILPDGLLQINNWPGGYDVASDGTLFYPPGGNATQTRHLVVVDREGKLSEWSGERQAIENWISASRDGNRCAQIITSADAIDEIWISERGQPVSHRLPTRAGADCTLGAWSPDGSRFAYYAGLHSADDGIYISSVDGTAPPRLLARRPTATGFIAPISWSPDGSTITAVLIAGALPHAYTIAIPTNPEMLAELKPWRHDGTSQGVSYFSPSGRVIAYASFDTGKSEIFVSKWNGSMPVGRPIPVGVGWIPYWDRDGKRLYFQTTQEKVMVVDITEAPELRASPPVEVWDLAALRVARANLGSLMDMLPDGRLLAVQRGEDEGNPTRVNVVLNFPDVLKKRMRDAGK